MEDNIDEELRLYSSIEKTKIVDRLTKINLKILNS